jgi:hypothetical protein
LKANSQVGRHNSRLWPVVSRSIPLAGFGR